MWQGKSSGLKMDIDIQTYIQLKVNVRTHTVSGPLVTDFIKRYIHATMTSCGTICEGSSCKALMEPF